MNNENKTEKITKNKNDTEFIDDVSKNSEFKFFGKNVIEKVDTVTIFNFYVENNKERNK